MYCPCERKRFVKRQSCEVREQCRGEGARQGYHHPSEIRAATACWGSFAPRPKVERILMLIYHCPTTTRIVRTSIEASEADLWRFRSLKLSLWCPHCQIGHSILAKDTQLDAN